MDSVIQPLLTTELMEVFPSHQMVSLVNHPVFVKGLNNVVCICEFGWRIFGNITKQQKILFCRSLYNLGITAIPHQCRLILTKGQLTVGLHIISRGLLGAGVRSIYLTAYGMKIMLAELQFLNNIQTPSNLTARYDIGVNVDTNYIPLFNILPSYEGKVYPMLLTEYGSVSIEMQTNSSDFTVQLKCYPRVIHFLKAYGLTMNIPCTNRGMTTKLKTICSIIHDISTQDAPICGHRFEFCFNGKLTYKEAYEMTRSYRVVEGLPEGVELFEKISVQQYKELIQYVYIEHEEIGKGRASDEPSISKKKGMVELLNAMGFFRPNTKNYCDENQSV